MEVGLRSYGRRHVDVDVTEGSGIVWRLTGVYGDSVVGRKSETWRMMRILGQQHQTGRPWLYMGDFNEILTCDEKCGGAVRPQTCMDRFREALEGCELSDIGYMGDKFTWRNHSKELVSYICERLDRATVNMQWCEAVPDFSVMNGNPRHSDHRSVIICTEGGGRRVHSGDRSFRFEAWWLQEEGCREVVKDAWEGVKATGGGVSQGMQAIAGSMRRWQKEVVGDLEERLRKARNELEFCMRAPVSEGKIKEEEALRCVIEDLEEKKNTKAK